MISWKGVPLDKVAFQFEETGEVVNFCILASLQMNEMAYLLVVDEQEVDDDEPTAYILKATEIDEDDIIYEIVDDDDELALLEPRFDELLKNSEFEME